jgi:hypothetical protein
MHREGMAQIVNPRRIMSASVDPTQLLAQQCKNAIDLAITQWLTQSLAARPDKKWQTGMFLNLLTAERSVAQQGGCHAGM